MMRNPHVDAMLLLGFGLAILFVSTITNLRSKRRAMEVDAWLEDGDVRMMFAGLALAGVGFIAMLLV
jgi:hypothetical protein